MTQTDRRSIFDALQPQAPDALLSLIGLFRDDPRPGKIDLGVGVYRDEAGNTPVFASIKAAEAVLQETQPTKSYLGPEGDVGFLEQLQPIIFGADPGLDLIALQTPGGTGALRLAAELVNASRPGASIWLGAPSWPNHAPIFKASGLSVKTYAYFDQTTQEVCFEAMLEALNQASPGDVVLLHGCCHNPTGADLSAEQWSTVAKLMVERRLTPLLDLAYQGLGDGLEEDAAGLRLVMSQIETVMVAYSCDKNFGLYRERTGALFVHAPGQTQTVQSNAVLLARCLWSMPPDHGAAAVRLILSSSPLAQTWRRELDGMRRRLLAVRESLARCTSALEPLKRQKGLFALLPVSPSDVDALRRDHAVYMAGSGRINLAGLTQETAPTFVEALQPFLPAIRR